MESVSATPFDVLPAEVAAYLAFVLGGACLPVPRAVVMPRARTADMACALRAAVGRVDSREALMVGLRAAYRPLARLRSVSRALAAAPWLLDWAELFDFYRASLCSLSGTVRHLVRDYTLDAQLRACADPATKAWAMQYLMQDGNSPYTPVYSSQVTKPNRAIAALDPAFSALPGPFFYWQDHHKVVAAAKRVRAARADASCVGFPLVGFENHASVTGQLQVHFLDELEVRDAPGPNGYKDLFCGERRVAIKLGYLRQGRLQGSVAAMDTTFLNMKRETLRRWADRFVQHQRETHALLDRLRARLKAQTPVRRRRLPARARVWVGTSQAAFMLV